MNNKKEDKVDLSEEEWREKLTPEEYKVCRLKGTEAPFSGEYYKNKEDGTYHCTACNSLLFDAKDKYDSGSGWPSFSEIAKSENIETKEDNSHGMNRIEVICKVCGSHLGHVFPDGPAPTGKRYCINSLSLKFKKR